MKGKVAKENFLSGLNCTQSVVLAFKDELGIDKNKLSLSDLSYKLEIENPRAHRALADALTTARVYLKLKEKFADSAENNLDDTLDDLDNW